MSVRREGLSRLALAGAIVALVVAAAGVGWSAATITGRAIRDGSLSGADLGRRALARADLAAEARTGPRGPRGAPGRPGADAAAAGAAGGVLTGTYPSPGLAATPPLRVIGASGEPPFGATWIWPSDAAPLGFWRDHAGVVHLTGVACTLAVRGCRTSLREDRGPVFTLPPGYRPSVHLVFTVAATGSGNLVTRVEVLPSGDVQVLGLPSALLLRVSFDGVAFAAAG